MKIDKYKNLNNNNPKNFIEDDYYDLEDLLGELNGVGVGRGSMLKDPVCVACIDLIATSIASMGINLYKTETNNSKVLLPLEVLQAPNPVTTQFEFLRDLVKDLLVYGQSFAYIETKAGKPKHLWNLNGSSTAVSKINGTYSYKINTTLHDKNMILDYKQVIHLTDISDRYNALKVVLEQKERCRTLINKAFESRGNKNLIKGLLQIPETLGFQAKDNIRKEFEKMFSNGKSGIGILDGGATYQPVANSNEKSLQEQLISELQEQFDKEIYSIFGVPKALVLGDGQQSSYASLEVVNNNFIKGLSKYVNLIEQEVYEKLLSTNQKAQGCYIKLNSRKALRLTDEQRMAFYKTALASGIYTISEIRALEDLPRIDTPISDSLMLSLNYCPADYYLEYLQAKKGSAIEEDNKDDKDNDNDNKRG